MKTCRVAIAGFGGVGRTVGAMLLARRARYRQLYDMDVRLVAVCGSRAGLADAAGLEAQHFAMLQAGLTGPDMLKGANVLIEAGPTDLHTGGPGLAYLRGALGAGMDAVVISKGALVHSGPELRALARATGARIKISGATAAALPTIDLLDHSLRGGTVLGLEGILNATTNYLLNAMMLRHVGFEEALTEAQAGGFAESDPRKDTQGWDTACKLLILANFGLGADLTLDDMVVEGIEHLTQSRIERWRGEGLTPRLVGHLRREDDGWHARVGIKTYRGDDAFAHVPGKTKAIRIVTDVMGEILAMGGGPEPVATASAALKDLEHLLEHPRAV
ncbi:MAG: homoserine dehydrogenase [Sphingomonadales bacterium]|nr:homoserine dehydrogenase [Sphingomonadales bacterium]MDE2168234.1 homoserine dehydrogenase [Sphingomonadales bacterium]